MANGEKSLAGLTPPQVFIADLGGLTGLLIVHSPDQNHLVRSLNTHPGLDITNANEVQISAHMIQTWKRGLIIHHNLSPHLYYARTDCQHIPDSWLCVLPDITALGSLTRNTCAANPGLNHMSLQNPKP